MKVIFRKLFELPFSVVGSRCASRWCGGLAILCLFCVGAFAQSGTIDSLEAKYALAKNDVERLDILESMADEAFGYDLHLALTYTMRGVSLADKLGDKARQPGFYEMHGRMYANMMILDSASYYFAKAEKGYRDVENKRGLATTYFKMGWVSKRKGEIENAMNSDLQALRLMEEIGDQEGIAGAYGRVSEDLLVQGRSEEGLEYALKGIEVCKSANIEGELFYAYRNAGDACIASFKPDEALMYYDKSKELAISLGFGLMDKADIANCRGNALKRLDRYEEARAEYLACYNFALESGYTNAVMAATGNLGEINLLMGNFAEALPYQLSTIKMQEEEGNMSNLVESYNHAATIYGNIGDYKLAWNYEKKARVLHDSLRSEKSDVALSELRTQYETEQKEATINAQLLQLDQRTKMQWLTAGVVVLLAGFLFFLYRLFRIRTKSNALLKIKNAENELLLKEIHHRVKNNLEVVSSLLELQSSQIDDQGIKDAMLEGQNRVHSIGIVHQKLYMGKNLGAIEMKDYFLNLSESVLDSFGADDRVTIDCAMDQLDVDIDTAVPLGLIVNELLTNTLKYAFPDGRHGKVRIHLAQGAEGKLHLEVSDNGIGKMAETKGTGFGSQLITLLTSQLSGSMREEIRNGTTIFFDFNMSKQYVQ